jgi:energy-coupling factor transporter transmembrane protein EcfT
MHPLAKFLIGLLLFVAGVYWYIGPFLPPSIGFQFILGEFRPTKEFIRFFVGIFGLVLIFFGFVIAWIEYEDWKWSKEAKKK